MGRTHDVTISGFDLDMLEAELDEMTLKWERTNDALFAERALADWLAEALKACRCNAIVIQELRYGFDGDCGAIRHAGLIEDDCELALDAWKEARSD